jgi:hypothetical protein
MTQDLERTDNFARIPLLLLAVVALVATPAAAQVDLVTNGDFESGFVPDETSTSWNPTTINSPSPGVAWRPFLVEGRSITV